MHRDMVGEAVAQPSIGRDHGDRSVGRVLAGDDVHDEIIGGVRGGVAGVPHLHIACGPCRHALDGPAVGDDDDPFALPIMGADRINEACEGSILVAPPPVGDRPPHVHGVDDDHGPRRRSAAGDGLVLDPLGPHGVDAVLRRRYWRSR